MGLCKAILKSDLPKCVPRVSECFSILPEKEPLDDEASSESIKHQGFFIDRNNAYCILKECERRKDLKYGRHLQSLLVQTGLDFIPVLGDHLIRLYAYHGNLVEANCTFNKITEPSLYTWNAITMANARLGEGQMALYLYESMHFSGLKNNQCVYVGVLKACLMERNPLQGRAFHEQIVADGLQSDIIVMSSLVDLYAKCGALKEACLAFEKLQNGDVVLWGAMVAGYVQHGKGHLALQCLETMEREGIKPNEVIFASGLKACASIEAAEQGRLIHVKMLDREVHSDDVVGNALVDMYAKCGCLYEACNVFLNLPNQDVVSWSSLMAGYVLHGEGFMALEHFNKMQEKCIRPNEVTFLTMLKACACIESIEHGRIIHGKIINMRLQSNDVLGSTLLDMYAKCGSLREACIMFGKLSSGSVVAYGAMISGYLQHGEDFLALECYQEMQEEHISPNEVIFSSILRAYTGLGAIEHGRFIHEQIMEVELQTNVVSNTLVDMYAKCGSLEDAFRVFDKFPNRDIVSWNTMIAGYVQWGESLSALECFDEMHKAKIQPNLITFLSTLRACGILGALDKGRQIHDMITKSELQSDAAIGSTLIDMYAKCGSLEDAFRVFNKLLNRDVISWNAVIGALAQHGQGNLALAYLGKMNQEGLKANEASLTNALTACSHACLVEEGHCCFMSMEHCHGILPTSSHSTCMVDLLGRAGYLSEAEDLLQASVQNDSIEWMSLLGACRLRSNMIIGRRCFDKIISLDPSHYVAAYILMSNIYADVQMREETPRWRCSGMCSSTVDLWNN